MEKIKVLIVDDSALVRKLMTEILNSSPAIEVVGTAMDPYVARDKIKKLAPDVITLDIEMPRMDGISFLKNLMRLHPLPVVMVSTLTEKGADITLKALELGAVDFVAKPKLDLANSLATYTDEIIGKVITAAGANVEMLTPIPVTAEASQISQKFNADVIVGKQSSAIPAHLKTTEKIIAIGASTGGTEAIKQVLSQLPASSPGIVIVQHIPAAFSKPFAERVNSVSAIEVCQAEDGQQILPGHAYIAPGDRHLLVRRSGAQFFCQIEDGPPVNRHKPSVDVLFRTVAQQVGSNAIGVMLTGMGDDGAKGMLEMKEAGAVNLAQDEKSSVVWGMPRQAVEIGATDEQIPLANIADKLLQLVQ